MTSSNQLNRMQFIEFILYWEGSIQNKDLVRQFGISRQKAWQDLLLYRKNHPEQFIDANKKSVYIAKQEFYPQKFVPEIDLYLEWIQSPYCFHQDNFSKKDSTSNPLRPSRNVAVSLIRKLVKAIKDKQRVEVDYVSLSNPDREGRIISPFTFVNTGVRWHIRGWCEKHKEYRDFVLSRFRGDVDFLGNSNKTGMDDIAWNTEITLILSPDRRLSKAQQEVIANDYQMKNSRLELKTKAALAHYLLQQIQVNLKTLDANPEAQQLELVNLKDVKKWLFH